MNHDKFFYSIDFSWEENGLGILSQWLPDIFDEVDKIFSYCRSSRLVFQNAENCGEEIERILQALSLYIKRIFGIDESESFDYAAVNKIFPKDLKTYLKKVACYPQLITKDDYDKANFINTEIVVSEEGATQD